MAKQLPLIIISGPSGSGEDSIIEGLAKRMPLERVITTSTRDKRHGEKDGYPYYFISQDSFECGVQLDDFFEYAQHYNNNYYGVTFEEINRVKHSGKVGIWKVDYKGVEKAKELIPNIVAIFFFYSLLQDLLNRHRKEALWQARGLVFQDQIHMFHKWFLS